MGFRRIARSPLLYYLRLPMPFRIGLLLAAGGGSIYMLTYLFRGYSMWIVVIGIAVVSALLLGFRQLLKWRKKRKSAPMEQNIVDQSASAPQQITEAGRRARLDDLRRNFEEGVAKFRAAGKDLYSLPWYVIVGEPGSGKTEAIRHCNVGFPPGLQDPFQGAGGTINMNWWFTNKAVILDTAGRLMFEEVEAGSTGEWQEFLHLLSSHRPSCPVNGLILVIPADTLITDTADAIKTKAEKIAQQLDVIRRQLQVRFPVFVAITKCDLVNGFREFFENVTDPALQHQILGWSNPADLDDPFNPEQVDQHLASVCDQLRRRRFSLLIDPVHTEDPTGGRRIEQVDALYAFPDSLSRIASRLRHYLEIVFAGGAWSGKPLFLRGIYFTSAMREGSALDEDLAEALGVPVESLPDGRVWERDRSYFLKDVFLEKAFKEQGLVTRAADAGGQHRRRKAIVLAAGFLSVLVLGLFTWFGRNALEESIGRHRDYWVAAARETNWDANNVVADGPD
ncbi:MAG: type VI secretion protein IcmF/TssM N-terminal domain-containing protein, partial [Planctomycetota bacterium]